MAGSGMPRPYPSRETFVHVQAEASGAIPALTYYWGSYMPPGTADVLITAVAAQLGQQIVPIKRPEDWGNLVIASGWRPTDTAATLQACVELASRTSHFIIMPWVPFEAV
jgi:hypothetical protein